jgi:hypothetical protein
MENTIFSVSCLSQRVSGDQSVLTAAKVYMSLIERFKDREVALILNYLQGMSEMTERLLAEATIARADGS